MSQKIVNPYNFVEEEKELIRKHFTDHRDWAKPAFHNIKSRIKSHLLNEQEFKCCYCKRQIGHEMKSVEIEHIIPKSKYSQFTFHSVNLALSCPACNIHKGVSDVITRSIKKYPKNGTQFLIIHPHYDNYYDHISISSNKIIYGGLTDKGTRTILICKLHKYNHIEESIKFNSELSNDKYSVKALTKVPIDDIEEIEKYSSLIIDKIKELKSKI